MPSCPIIGEQLDFPSGFSSEKGFECLKRLLTGVMFDTLSVHLCDFVVDAKGKKKISDDAVAFAGLLGERSALVRKENRAIASLSDQPVPCEALQCAVDSRRRDAGALGEIDGARFARGVDQVGDQLDIVLGRLLLMRPPHLLEAPRLPLRLT